MQGRGRRSITSNRCRKERIKNEVSVTAPPARSVGTLVFVGGAVVGWFTTDVAAADVVLVADVDFELVFETLVAEVTEVGEVVVEEDNVLIGVDVVGAALGWSGGGGWRTSKEALSNRPVDGLKT